MVELARGDDDEVRASGAPLHTTAARWCGRLGGDEGAAEAARWPCDCGRRPGRWRLGLENGGEARNMVSGRKQELTISVWDPTDRGSQPRGKQVLKPGGIMYTANTGIWQTVWLEPVPETHIDAS